MSFRDDLCARIERDGPLPFEQVMDAAIAHYYATRPAFGRAGDFITAPEISQVFGELLGLWLLTAWQAAGRPTPFVLAELGPGRGTLMADLLRMAVKADPEFVSAARLVLVERSARLRELQAQALQGHAPAWVDAVEDLPEGPLFAVANEFFDALPVAQAECTPDGWRLRRVHVRAGQPVPVADGDAVAVPFPQAPVGAIAELCPAAQTVMASLAERIAQMGGALLAIDYGYTDPAPGDTVQAVADHKPVEVWPTLGDADLTAHVNFAALAQAARGAGAEVLGPAMQGDFLRRLGAEPRAWQLASAAGADRAEGVTAAVRRLIAGDQMGALFKVLGVVAPGLAFDEGFRT